MLRVYCSCPGVSAMMNLRPVEGGLERACTRVVKRGSGAGLEVAIRDVDRDPLLALGPQTVCQ